MVEFTFEAFKTKIWGNYRKAESLKGAVVLVHGFGEHSERYANSVILMLLNAGISVVTYDNVGHGKSGGKRGHCPSYEALLDILEQVVAKARELHPDLPLFLYGHSMGGNLVLNYALKRDTNLAGVVATSPYLRLAFQPPKWKMVLGRVMLRMNPSMTLPSGLDPIGISRIPQEVEKYKNDTLIHDKVSPMFSFPIMDAGEWAIQNADQLKVDAFLLHGTADSIIDPEGTKEFHQNAVKTTLELFEGGYHELHNDNCKAEMLQAISDWLKQQLV
ncbi:alpha/beta hydrolase [Maribacter algarum]|nr:alpha/beta hydrolase [Maribacter algarum]